MIDFLSNPDWIKPQIDCLLFLQNIRITEPEFIDKFFLSITIFGEFLIPTIICSIIYWCIDFRAGIYLFSLESFNVFFAHLFKMIACVYRPWILDDKIHPSALAVPYAKGYSFPSGHSAMSSSVFGGLAFLLRKNKFICFSLILLILTVGFSRLWLGVHTPQDVVCGLLIGLILIFAVNVIINWAEKNPNRYLYLLGIFDLAAILALIYIYFFNNYRIDYIDGQLLVNPIKLKYLTVIVYSYILGLTNGCYLCRRFFPYEPKETSLKLRIIRGIIGTTIVIWMLRSVLEQIFLNTIHLRIAIPERFIMGFVITLIYPIIFKKFNF